jgi:hypothetical protein
MHKGKLSRLQVFATEISTLAFHAVVVGLSAGIAWSLPNIARQFLAFWSHIEQEKILLLTIEVGVALLLIVMSNYLWQAYKDRRQAVMARGAGLVSFFPLHDPGAGRRIRELKQQQSLGRTVLAIGVTGHGTVVDNKAEMHALLETCLEAKLILLNPFSEEAARRAQSLSHPDISPDRFQQELHDTIALIKRFRINGKVIRLKLYSDRPHLRMVILGDYLWLQHYHTDSTCAGCPNMSSSIIQTITGSIRSSISTSPSDGRTGKSPNTTSRPMNWSIGRAVAASCGGNRSGQETRPGR